MDKIVVLGGGFAGIEAVIKLKKLGYNVTLVSNRDFLFIYPISIWIPTKENKFEDAKLMLTDLQKVHKFDLIIDEVTGIEPNNNKVILKSGSLDYDYLFIAFGMHKVKNKGVENTLTICGSPEDTLKVRDELEKLVLKGSGNIAVGFAGNPNDEASSTLRGGPGFEIMFNIATYLKKKGIRENFEINFFAPMAEPGKKMGPKAFNKIGEFYDRYNIKRYIGKKIKEFQPRKVIFEDDSELSSDLIIFIAGGSGNSVVINSGLAVNKAGFIKISDGCQAEGYSNIYAIGDVAEITGTEWIAKQGHMAEMMADVAVNNFQVSKTGIGELKSYKDHISIICLMDSGDGAAMVTRTTKGDSILVMPIIGHWLKKAWGFYYKYSKLNKFPRIPGL
jgi:sulfide:quinone oxidoreductase